MKFTLERNRLLAKPPDHSPHSSPAPPSSRPLRPKPKTHPAPLRRRQSNCWVFLGFAGFLCRGCHSGGLVVGISLFSSGVPPRCVSILVCVCVCVYRLGCRLYRSWLVSLLRRSLTFLLVFCELSKFWLAGFFIFCFLFFLLGFWGLVSKVV